MKAQIDPEKEAAIQAYLKKQMGRPMSKGGKVPEKGEITQNDIVALDKYDPKDRMTQDDMMYLEKIDPSTTTAKGYAPGGEVTDDFDVSGGDSDTLKGLPLPVNAVPTPDIPQSSIPANNPSDTSEGNDADNEKVASSHPGTQADELTPYLKQLETNVDKFGPEQEAQVMNSLRQGYKKPGFIASEGLAGLGDSIMQGVARAGQGNALNTIERNKEMALTQAPEEMKQLREGNLQGMKEKMALEGMSGATPLGASQLGPSMFLVKQMFPDMSAAEQAKMAQNPAALQAMLPQGVSLKEALARIQETGAYQQGMLANTAASRTQQGNEFAVQHPIAAKLMDFKTGGTSTPSLPTPQVGKVNVVSPDGKTTGTIPVANLKKALARGYKQLS